MITSPQNLNSQAQERNNKHLWKASLRRVKDQMRKRRKSQKKSPTWTYLYGSIVTGWKRWATLHMQRSVLGRVALAPTVRACTKYCLTLNCSLMQKKVEDHWPRPQKDWTRIKHYDANIYGKQILIGIELGKALLTFRGRRVVQPLCCRANQACRRPRGAASFTLLLLSIVAAVYQSQIYRANVKHETI